MGLKDFFQGGHATTRQFTAAVVQVWIFGKDDDEKERLKDLNFFLKGMGKSLEQSNQGKTTKSFSF